MNFTSGKESLMNIAIVGASGMIGQQITLEALVRGYQVTALVRSPERFPITHPHLSVRQVNLFDAASLADAFTESDVVVNATGNHSADVYTFFVHSTKALIEGVQRAGGKRLITVGGAGSLEVAPGVQLVDTPEFPAPFRSTAQAQCETLNMYRASTIDWTFFSPSALIEPGKRTGRYRVGTDQLLSNEQGESSISVADYATALLDEIEEPHFIRRRFTAVSLKN
jgi:putative NADH-flavin reductase